MSRIDIDKLLASLYEQEFCSLPSGTRSLWLEKMDSALKDQGLRYEDDKIIPIDSPAKLESIEYGAYDSELIEETIYIPEGCKAVIDGDKIIIKKEKPQEPFKIESGKSYKCISEESKFFTKGKVYIAIRNHVLKDDEGDPHVWIDDRNIAKMFRPVAEKEVSDDERMWKIAIEFVRQNNSFEYLLGVSRDEVISWLEKQKQVDTLTAQEAMDIAVEKCFNEDGKQKPVEWSEEDETGWTNTMIMIKECASNHYTKDSIKLVVDWLKSIKQRLEGKT